MVFRLIAPNRLEVTLSPQEIEQSGIDFENDSSANLKRLKKYLLSLLAQAQTQADDFFLFGESLVIEIYAEENGGATVLFSSKGEKAHELCQPVVFCFDNSEDMLLGATKLFALHGHRLFQSALYQCSMNWLLIIRPMDGFDSPAVRALYEYGEFLQGGSLVAALVEEHCKPIILEHAVDMISYYFS